MEPKITELLQSPERRHEVSIAFALLWLAAADGALNTKAYAYVNRHAEALAGGLQHSDALLSVIAANDLDSFLLVCRVLRELEGEARQGFMQLVIGTATAGDSLTTSANHILRLYADLLGMEPGELQELFRERTGRELPEPGDPSAVEWWEQQEHTQPHSRRQEDSADSTNHLRSPGKRLSRAEAFAILGLEHEVSRVEIKRAYRRLVQSYHPDRFESRGLQAREEAERRFIQVQQAYEVLTG